MTVVIRNKKTAEERARYENVINIMVQPKKAFSGLWLGFENEDRMEYVDNDEFMNVE